MHQQPLLSLRQRLHADTIKPFVPSGGILVELNCVQPSYLINQLKSGMDFCIGVTGQPNRLDGNVQYLQARIKKTIPIESDLANVVVVADLPAFHENPRAILTECFRILKPAGTLIVVMPRSADNWLTRIGAWSGWLPKTTPSGRQP